MTFVLDRHIIVCTLPWLRDISSFEFYKCLLPFVVSCLVWINFCQISKIATVIQSVTLGDEEASRRGVQKTVLERKGPSTFSCGVEIITKTELRVHRNLEATVDAVLSGFDFLLLYEK